jgi:hypothetical protein
LIDEVDRSDPEFEALLLEVLSDFQVTVPELGTMRANATPFVVLTSNATRELTEALRRRCLHLFLDYPTPSRELAIVRRHVPDAAPRLTEQLVAVVQAVRRIDLRKTPSVAEAIDWARALVLGARALDPEVVRQTLGVLKHREDTTLEGRDRCALSATRVSVGVSTAASSRSQATRFSSSAAGPAGPAGPASSGFSKPSRSQGQIGPVFTHPPATSADVHATRTWK